jgi:NADH-quinone oxidoreductase subunit A
MPPSFELTTYVPIFIYLVIILLFAAGTLIAAHVIGPYRETPVKQMPYESGMDPIGDTRHRFDVKFYLIAILFLVFDVELLFLYPWAVGMYGTEPKVDSGVPGAVARVGQPGALQNLAVAATQQAEKPWLAQSIRRVVFWEIIVFIATLFVAYVYAWRKGVFQWR